MSLLSTWKDGVEHAWGSLSEGWRELRDRAAGALTRYRRGEADAPADDDAPPFAGQWGYLAADVFGDDDKLVVRLEAPGMRRDDFTLELHDRVLVISGCKRFERDARHGRYHIVQCAYGNFRRVIELPVPVHADKARATYRDGVLRIELPKREPWRTQRIAVQTR